MPDKKDTWKFDEVEVFLFAILLVGISKYWTIYLDQSVFLKFSWREISIQRLRWKTEFLIKKYV